jgi:hypothetical protein
VQFKAGTQVWTWDRCYGRDNSLLPTELSEHVLATIASNVELTLNTLPRRRAGSTAQNFSGGAAFDGFVKLGRFFGHIGTADLTSDEWLFWSDRTGKLFLARMNAFGTAPVLPATSFVGTTFSAFGRDVVFCQFNDKLYVARQSSVDRLHVIDARFGSPVLRRVGLQRPAAPSPANQGAGTYSGFRYYRVQARNSGTAPSNLGDPVGFTPSGTGDRVRVNLMGVPSLPEPVTVWAVYASMDNALYYNISGDLNALTTTFFDDMIAPASYASYPPAPEEGSYNTWPSVRFLLAGVDRLIGFGVAGGADGGAVADGRAGNVSTQGRVWFSPVLGTTANSNDDERVPVQLAGGNPIQNWIDVGRGSGETDTGLGGPIDGMALVFQSRGIYLLIPTGNVYAPFKRVTVSTDVGAVEGSIFNGQDELGRPATYFWDPTAGPYRYGAAGLQWLGFDVRDVAAEFNRLALPMVRAHGCFHNQSQTAFFWLATGTVAGATTCNRLMRFNARLGKDTGPTGVRFGWTDDNGDFATATGSVIARYSANSAGLQPNAVFQPLVATGPKVLMRDPAQITDAGTAYRAVIASKTIQLSASAFQIHQLVTDWLYVQAARAQTNVRVDMLRNYGDTTNVEATRSLSPPLQLAESRVLVRFEGIQVQDAYAIAVQIGDPLTEAATANWQLDYVTMPLEVRTQERWNPSA